jgi:hypothetical protein
MRRCCAQRLPVTRAKAGLRLDRRRGVKVARMRNHIIDDLGHPRQWTKTAGYWKRGHADTHEDR